MNKALVSRVLTEVGYAQHIMWYHFSERGGARPSKLYSFGEVVNLLHAPHPRVDFGELQAWVGNAITSPELTAILKTVCQQDTSDRERSGQCREPMVERLAQSKAAR